MNLIRKMKCGLMWYSQPVRVSGDLPSPGATRSLNHNAKRDILSLQKEILAK